MWCDKCQVKVTLVEEVDQIPHLLRYRLCCLGVEPEITSCHKCESLDTSRDRSSSFSLEPNFLIDFAWLLDKPGVAS
jgi:hypothetical protein